ncbi:dihydrofolate reductase [Paenibacillus soyae]|uniref:Dihydrofolate reductase n=1 Tax=Paenibacillus soyae TaxID=2969249 RepID=A0A9X2MM43_9BACL|nr:dihydrofolate reductase [Paenibacillus soyae]MCR2802860.1 dihydrofolate reductase [Paenibacillus soyae]
MPVTLIWAMDRNRAIGGDNRMLWHLPADMAFFRKTTTGKTVLMGRKTYESLGKPLPNRRNVVLTRQEGLELEGCEVIHDIEEAIGRYGEEELMVIGGAEVYALALPYADKLLLTDVDAEIADADAFFPIWEEDEWTLTDSVFREKDERNPYDCRFCTYERVLKPMG